MASVIFVFPMHNGECSATFEHFDLKIDLLNEGKPFNFDILAAPCWISALFPDECCSEESFGQVLDVFMF